VIGSKAGPYVLERLLGEGGMGAVYLARHERLPLQKAVKVLLPEYSRHPDILRRFENESMAAARL
jgi:eukaryotic-like serine/threonine-protein kinase